MPDSGNVPIKVCTCMSSVSVQLPKADIQSHGQFKMTVVCGEKGGIWKTFPMQCYQWSIIVLL